MSFVEEQHKLCRRNLAPRYPSDSRSPGTSELQTYGLQDETDNLFPLCLAAHRPSPCPVGECWLASLLQRREVASRSSGSSRSSTRSNSRAYFNEERCQLSIHTTSTVTCTLLPFSGQSKPSDIASIFSSEFHDLPLTWESGAEVPSWLSGTYVR